MLRVRFALPVAIFYEDYAMAYERRITTIPILLNTAIGSGSAGGTSTSDPIDLRDIAVEQKFTLHYKVIPSGSVGSAATTNFKYTIASTKNGIYSAPITGDAGTIGTAGGTAGAISFTPVTAPFMKILSIAGTSGTASVTTELSVQ